MTFEFKIDISPPLFFNSLFGKMLPLLFYEQRREGVSFRL